MLAGSVLLPLKAAAALGSNDLELKAAGLSITLPNDVLASVQKVVSGSEADGSRILFEAKPIDAAAASSLINGMDTPNQADFKAASDVYEFKLRVIAKDG